MIVDCHTHLNRYTPDLPPTLGERYGLLRREMDAHGLHYALVLTSYKVNAERPSLSEVLEVVGGDPRIGVAAGISMEGNTPEGPIELREHLRAGRIRALKLYPGYEHSHVHSRSLDWMYELAAEFRVPVMIHTGDTYDRRAKIRYAHPLEVDEAAVEWRGVNFVLCHLGNPWFTDAMEVMYKNENVFGDLSGLTLGDFAERYERMAVRHLNDIFHYMNDPTRVMFGTDWPICDLGSYLRFVDKLDLTGDEREGLLWKNAARVFRLPLGGFDPVADAASALGRASGEG